MKSQVAQAAQQIRAILKKEFPEIKFSVTSQNYSGGDSINVKYENGLPPSMIEEKIGHFQSGNFNGQEDMYEYNNNRNDIPQTKYLFIDRSISKEIREAFKKEIAAKYGIKNESDEQEWSDMFHMWSDQVIWTQIKNLTIKSIIKQ